MSRAAMRRVCVVTGSRSEYGIVRPIMRKIAACAPLELQVAVAGMHLSDEFGRTVDLIERDGFRVDARVDMLFGQDTGSAMAKGIGAGVLGFAQSFEILRPDVVLVQGDRVEPFAAAVAASFAGFVVAHTHGGDVGMGGFDEYMRPAITHFAHLHFAATERSRRRILALGEREEYVFTVGTPALDEAVATPLLGRAEIERRFDLPPGSPFLLVVQHPVSTRPGEAAAEMQATLDALGGLALPAVLLFPNSDAGSRAMIEVIKAHTGSPWLRVFKNLPRLEYLSLLAATAALVGNSSSGMVESSHFRVPVVNVGTRQQGRERSTNVLDVAHDADAIVQAVRAALDSPEFQARVRACVNPYGDGKASDRIVDVLATVALDERLRHKEFRW